MDMNNTENTNNTVQTPVDNTVQPVEPVQPIQPMVSTNVNNNMGTIETKKKSSLPIIIVVVLVIIGIVGYFVVSGLIGKNEAKKEEQKQLNNKAEALTNQPPVKVGWIGRYGLVDVTGNVIINMNEGKYTDISSFHHGIAVADYGYYDKEKEKRVENWVFINTKGEELLTVVQDKYYFNGIDAWIINGVLYDTSLKKLSPDGLTIVDYGDEYNHNKTFQFKTNDNKIGLINSKGKILFEITIDPTVGGEVKIPKQQFTNIDGYAYVTDTKKYYLINSSTGKVVKEFEVGNDFLYLTSSDSNHFYIRVSGIEYDEAVYSQILVINDEIVFQTSPYGYDTYNNSISYAMSTSGYYYLKKDDVVSYYNLCDKKIYDDASRSCSIKETTVYARIYDYSDYNIEGNKVVKGDKVIIDDEKYTSYAHFPYNVYKTLENAGKEYIVGLDDNRNGYVLDLKTGKEVYNLGYYGVFGTTTSLFMENNNKQSSSIPGMPSQECYINLLSDQEFCFTEDEDPTFGENFYYVMDDKNEKQYYNSYGDKFFDTKDYPRTY